MNPRWKGQIGLETEEYQWFYHLVQILGKEKGLDYMRRLAGQNLQMRKGHTLLAQLVAAGEMALAVVVYSNRVERMRMSGAPIDWVRFKGPTITAINAISIPEKAPHPNAAKLFVDFVLSREGQNLLRGLRRIPARPDVAAGSTEPYKRTEPIRGAARRNDRELQRNRHSLRRNFQQGKVILDASHS